MQKLRVNGVLEMLADIPRYRMLHCTTEAGADVWVFQGEKFDEAQGRGVLVPAPGVRSRTRSMGWKGLASCVELADAAGTATT